MDEVIVRCEGRAGRLTLNRPKALNALTWPMVKAIRAALDAWESDPAVHHIVLDGAGERGLCAGGDVRWLYDRRPSGTADANGFWRDEYRLNARIARYPKPYIALMDGIVMGGGIGLSAHARHRIVTERSTLAMPETTIGLIPDVGATHVLARAQGRLGIYLGLTGARMTGSDAIQAGFADSYVTAARLPELVGRLTTPGQDNAEEIIEAMAEPVPPSPLAANRDLIDQLFGEQDVLAILKDLHKSTHEIATKARADLATRSPLALVLTAEALRRAAQYDTLEQALVIEYRLCTRLYERGEFIEGVRALIVDKDKAPRWKPARIDDVDAATIASYFGPMTPDWPAA